VGDSAGALINARHPAAFACQKPQIVARSAAQLQDAWLLHRAVTIKERNYVVVRITMELLPLRIDAFPFVHAVILSHAVQFPASRSNTEMGVDAPEEATIMRKTMFNPVPDVEASSCPR